MAASPPTAPRPTDDGTLHEVWNVADADRLSEYQLALAGEDVFVADVITGTPRP